MIMQWSSLLNIETQLYGYLSLQHKSDYNLNLKLLIKFHSGSSKQFLWCKYSILRLKHLLLKMYICIV